MDLKGMTKKELIGEVEALQKQLAEPAAKKMRTAGDLKKIRERLREYERFVESPPESIVCVVDRKYRYRLANRAFSRYYNKGRDVVGWSVPDVVGEVLFQKAIKKKLDRCFQGETVRYEAQQVDDRLDEKTLLVSYVPVYGPNGVDRAACFMRDITDQKHLEEALKVSEGRYSDLFESLPDGFVAIDGNKRFVRANRAFQAMTGYTEDELRELSYEDITPERWHAFVQKINEQQVLPRGYSDVYEKEYVKKDGTVFPVELRVHLEKNNGAGPPRTWAFVRDISERVRLVKALGESEKKFRLLFEKLVHPVILLEGDVCVDCNEAAVRAMGRQSMEEVRGLTVSGASPERQPDGRLSSEKAQELIGTTLRKGFNRFEWVHQDLDGREFWTDVTQTVIPIDGKDILFNMWRNITEHKRAEEALKQRERELEDKSRNLEEANIALKVLLAHREDDKKMLEKTVVSNVTELVLPYVERLRSRSLKAEQAACLDIIESGLNEVISPFLSRMTGLHPRFTPMELRIANLIKSGKTSKEIAEMLKVGAGTVHTHRNSIRAKLGLNNKNVNLCTYLLSLAE